MKKKYISNFEKDIDKKYKNAIEYMLFDNSPSKNRVLLTI